jgi:hypothetical protein
VTRLSYGVRSSCLEYFCFQYYPLLQGFVSHLGGYYYALTKFKVFWSLEILYNAAVFLTRASILLFYLRIFQQPWFRRLVWLALGVVFSSAIIFSMIIIFQCIPVNAIWDKSNTSAKCVNLHTLTFAAAGIGIGQDIVILFLPIPALAKLNMNSKKKSMVLFMFSIGAM